MADLRDQTKSEVKKHDCASCSSRSGWAQHLGVALQQVNTEHKSLASTKFNKSARSALIKENRLEAAGAFAECKSAIQNMLLQALSTIRALKKLCRNALGMVPCKPHSSLFSQTVPVGARAVDGEEEYHVRCSSERLIQLILVLPRRSSPNLPGL